jgi:hypothetical protein
MLRIGYRHLGENENRLEKRSDLMSFQDLIGFLTKEFVQYVDTPKDERMKKKQEKKKLQGNWSQHWFGAIPIAISMMFKRNKKV